jgi:hypothetical protein
MPAEALLFVDMQDLDAIVEIAGLCTCWNEVVNTHGGRC